MAAAVLILAMAPSLQAQVPAPSPSPSQISIETAGQGNLITVAASADMQVEARAVWDAITDYDNLADFIPDMSASRVLERNGDKLLVEQKGQFRFLLFRQAVEVRMEVVESPQRRIVARAVSGNVKEFDGVYAVERLPAGVVRLSYSGRLIPDFPVPPVVGALVVRSVLARQFSALVDEIVRRDESARGIRQP
ncbi:SRPBCC family protein [Variovorax humicola]|uniref:SRPBCC family protein n=1 Tax=Variovorax humicola TaxID=1769758 RepID=A0ABU8VX49_9BURK